MDTKLAKINELQSVLSNTDATINRIRQFMQPFNLGTTLHHYSQVKEKGYKLTDVLIWLLLFRQWA